MSRQTITGRPNAAAADTDRTEASHGPTHAFASSDPLPKTVFVAATTSLDAATRYRIASTLGQGGMGEVRLCSDAFVGRDVAMKVSTVTSPSAQARFLREARVQGQLEHPAVVPVYDIGVEEGNNTFFTMKRIVGYTFEDIINGLHAGDPDLTARFTQRRLLTALSQIALALEFAHQRGVIHRDLKPANLMLGNFGEVYVLDWGIAKIAAADAHTQPSPDDHATTDGTILGTPGYLSPEQAQGRSNECDPRSDLYSLGLVLYEVLTLEFAHEGPTVGKLLSSTLQLDGARPRARRADVARELDDLCWQATRLDPADRYASARALHDDLERFLDGELDRERRQALADKHVARAEKIVDRMVEDPGSGDETRAAAMRELGSALALHPGHMAAQETLFNLMLAEPDTMPKRGQIEVDERIHRFRADASRKAAIAIASWFPMFPLLLWMGIRNVGLIVAFAVAALIMAVFHVMASRARRPRVWRA